MKFLPCSINFNCIWAKKSYIVITCKQLNATPIHTGHSWVVAIAVSKEIEALSNTLHIQVQIDYQSIIGIDLSPNQIRYLVQVETERISSLTINWLPSTCSMAFLNPLKVLLFCETTYRSVLVHQCRLLLHVCLFSHVWNNSKISSQKFASIPTTSSPLGKIGEQFHAPRKLQHLQRTC